MVHYSIFYIKKDKNKYLFNIDNGKNLEDILKEIRVKNKNFYKVYLPLDTDNEWQGLNAKYRDIILNKNRGRLIIKSQSRPLLWDIHDTIVHNHWDLRDFSELKIPIRYRMLDKGIGYVGVQILNSIPSIEATLYLADDKAKRDKLKKLKKEGKIFSFVEYAHFGLVDFLPRFEGKFKKSIETLYRSNNYQQIKHTKHHHTKTEFTTKDGHTVSCDFIRPNWILVINGVYFAVEFECHDSFAIIGNAGAALISLAPSAGVQLPYKDILKDKNGDPLDKSLYLDIYSNPEYYDIEHKYSIGDCVAYKCLEGMNKLYEKVDEPLGISDKTGILPKTLGSNTAQRIKARWEVLAENEGIELDKETLEQLKIGYSANSAEELCKNPLSTESILGKGFGGRCFINKPRLITCKSVMMDADAKSAYVSIMMRQPIGFGISQKLTYSVDGNILKCPTIEKFYKKYGSEIVKNNYETLITLASGGTINNPELLELPEDLDYFFSYKPPIKWTNIVIPDNLDKPLFKLPDQTVIRTRTLQNTIFTHSEYEILMKLCSPKTRNFILKNARVIAANFYPKSKQVNTISEALDGLDKGFWYQTTIGDLIISILKERRDFYKKVTGGMKELKRANFKYKNLSEQSKKAIEQALANSGETFDELVYAAMNYSKYPLDDLNKYAGNCVFGSIQSPFFMIGNCVSGNNITAQCRQFVIVMEKFLNLAGAITDGQVGDVNQVLYPKEITINNRQVCRVDNYKNQELNQKFAIQYKPLGEYNKIEWESEDSNNILFHTDKDVVMNLGDATKLIEKLANEHVKKLGKGLSTVNYLEIELKGLQRELVLHGQSNYMLYGGSHELYKKGENSLTAMRSYPKRVGSEAYNFLNAIRLNPYAVPRQKPFELEYILKPNEYKIRYKTTYSKKCFIPGDGVFKVAWIREFSPSSLVYQSSKQAESWEREYTYLKNKYGQSYEYFFLNDDGTLDYANMIRILDDLIHQGYRSYTEYLIKNNSKYSELKDYKNLKIEHHPYWKEYLELKEYINNLGFIDNLDSNSDWDDIDWEDYEPYEEGDESDINYHDAAKDMTAEEIEAMFDDIEINL
ncbi:hypothetical protein HW132_28635 [Brasilonema sp. CT11]|nr:hypothetical protein [Brasilonema sp. CT11]